MKYVICLLWFKTCDEGHVQQSFCIKNQTTNQNTEANSQFL
jgi:hypothetical protein